MRQEQFITAQDLSPTLLCRDFAFHTASQKWRSRFVRQITAGYLKSFGKQPNNTVVEAMAQVPRHYYTSNGSLELNYSDEIVPMDFQVKYQSSSSRPSLTVRMLEHLQKKQSSEDALGNFLDIGSGSGFVSAVAHRLNYDQVTGVEINPYLAEMSVEALKKDGLYSPEATEHGVTILNQDLNSLEFEAGFNAIHVGVLLDHSDQLKILTRALCPGGTMVAPVSLRLLTKQGRQFKLIQDKNAQNIKPNHGVLMSYSLSEDGDYIRERCLVDQVLFVGVQTS